MLGSGFSVQSGHVFLLFSLKLVLFSPNFFNLDANFFGNWPFLVLRERCLGMQEFSSGKLVLSAFWQESGLFPILALCKLPFFYKNAHHRDDCSHLTCFCDFNRNFIRTHVITRGYIDDFD
jgi:hypothetical protein